MKYDSIKETLKTKGLCSGIMYECDRGSSQTLDIATDVGLFLNL